MIAVYLLFALAACGLVYQWERFNYMTTHSPLVGMFGQDEIVTILAQVIVGVDILFLLYTIISVLIGRSRGDSIAQAIVDDPLFRAIGLVWVLTTATDVFLTWFYFAAKMELEVGADIMAPAAVVEYLTAAPMVVAVLSWLAQAALVTGTIIALQRVTAALKQRGGHSERAFHVHKGDKSFTKR